MSRFTLSRPREITSSVDIAKVEKKSPVRSEELMEIEMENMSPISSITHELRRSSLDPPNSNNAKSHYFQCSDSLGTSHRVNGQRSEGMISCAIQNKDLNERTLGSTKLLQLCSKWLQSPCGNSMLGTYSNKENESAPNYQNFSPQKNVKKTRWPLEDYDPNSQDSGYGANDNKEEKQRRDGFQFAEPSGVAPRRMSVDSRSPVQSPMRLSPQQTSVPRSSFMRLSSGYESMVDDGFTELIDMEALDDTSYLPSGISTLLSGDLVTPGSSSMECDVSTTPEFSVGKLKRSLSLCESNMTLSRSLSKVRTCLFRSPGATSSTATLLDQYEANSRKRIYFDNESPQSSRSYKRPSDKSPVEDSPRLALKKLRLSKSFSVDAAEATVPNPKQPCLQRSLSETEAKIKSAVHRSVIDSDLTGDFSKPCVLPLATGYHEDLKCISSITLAALIRGEFADRVKSYKIVDCRYPYEYDGGHIGGALNLYSKDLIEQTLFNPLMTIPKIRSDNEKRDILVLHCEFSYERGPNLSRFLRSLDRQRNKELYPALHYPEIYLLHGGYEQFYREHKEFCSPRSYRPMRHPDHEEDLRQFRSKSKSWQGDKSRLNSQTMRSNLKRLGF